MQQQSPEKNTHTPRQQTIFRVVHDRRYTTIANATLQDRNLTWAGRGLIAYLLSLPQDWDICLSHLVNQAPNGWESLRSCIRELLEAKYLTRHQERDRNGRMGRVVYTVFERPYDAEAFADNGLTACGKPVGGLTASGEPATTNNQLQQMTNKSLSQLPKTTQERDIASHNEIQGSGDSDRFPEREQIETLEDNVHNCGQNANQQESSQEEVSTNSQPICNDRSSAPAPTPQNLNFEDGMSAVGAIAPSLMQSPASKANTAHPDDTPTSLDRTQENADHGSHRTTDEAGSPSQDGAKDGMKRDEAGCGEIPDPTDKELLDFIIKEGERLGKSSPIGWAKTCLQNNYVEWLNKCREDRRRRSANGRIRNAPTDRSGQTENPEAYGQHQSSATPYEEPLDPNRLEGQFKRLNAKWQALFGGENSFARHQIAQIREEIESKWQGLIEIVGDCLQLAPGVDPGMEVCPQ